MMSTYSRYKPGKLPSHKVTGGLATAQPALTNFSPGDVGFVYDHKPSLVHEAIWARQRAEAGKDSEWANLTHMFCVTGSDGTILEMLSEGCVQNNVSKYKDMDFWIVHVDATDEQRDLCVRRWNKQRGVKYSKVTFVTEALMSFGFPLRLGWGYQLICSGLSGFGMLAWVDSFPKMFEEQTPFDIAQFLNLPINSPVRSLSFVGRLMNRIVFTGRIFRRFLP